MDKERIDKQLVNRDLARSRAKAKRVIMSGVVYVDGSLVDKPGQQVSEDADIEVRGEGNKYVSRGGKKLQGVLGRFEVTVEGCRALDIGASTGGFTDCLLQHGAVEVWALDVGKGQLDWKLRNDDRVHVRENFNARYLEPEDLPYAVDLITIDVSFISLELILSPAASVIRDSGQVLVLVKPQFEAGPGKVERGGVVNDPQVHRQVLERLIASAREQGLAPLEVAPSPVRGKVSKNVEYFLLLQEGVPSYSGIYQQAYRAIDEAQETFSD
ncbi:MAG: TlyA family RNA methyltransferase [Candidatus Bipolaricaulota bacterium]